MRRTLHLAKHLCLCQLISLLQRKKKKIKRPLSSQTANPEHLNISGGHSWRWDSRRLGMWQCFIITAQNTQCKYRFEFTSITGLEIMPRLRLSADKWPNKNQTNNGGENYACYLAQEQIKYLRLSGGKIPILWPVIIHSALLLSDFCGRSFLSMPKTWRDRGYIWVNVLI